MKRERAGAFATCREKSEQSGGPLLQTAELSVRYPPFCLSLSKPGSLRVLKHGNRRDLKKIKERKSQAEMGRTRYIGLNIYTVAIQNFMARAPRAAEAAEGGRPGRPALVYCFKREEVAAAGAKFRPRT